MARALCHSHHIVTVSITPPNYLTNPTKIKWLATDDRLVLVTQTVTAIATDDNN